MIENVINALTEKDSKALASCFSEDCRYFDYCPSLNGDPCIFIYGNECLEMFFGSKLALGDIVVAEPVIESARSANYFGAYYGPYVYARLNIEEYDSAGLIKKVVVHPA